MLSRLSLASRFYRSRDRAKNIHQRKRQLSDSAKRNPDGLASVGVYANQSNGLSLARKRDAFPWSGFQYYARGT